MKKEIKYAVFVISLIIFAAASFTAQDNPLAALSGEAAIGKLKQTGQYESLAEAVKAARKKDGQTEAAADAVGQTAKLVASDGTNGDAFGQDVAISGNTAVAGAWSDDIGKNSVQGSVYVFVRSGTAWTEQQILRASDGADGDGFGVSVAIEGDTIIVGAWHDNVGGNENQGSAYVFVRSGATWSEQRKLTASDGTAIDEFGRSVEIDGDTVIVGAYQDIVGGNGDQGSAYIFVRNGGVWTEQQKLTASDGAAHDNFCFVAISGDTAVVGAVNDDFNNQNQGSAYVFVRSGTVWTEQQKLFASDGAADDEFGRYVAIDGDTIIVGSWGDDVGANLNQGSAYVFVRSGATWTQQQKLFASDAAAGNFFGSVAIDGDTIIVGANAVNVGLNIAQGSAYIFTRSGAAWTEQQKLTASDGAEGDRFGLSVAIDGNKIFVGANDANIGMENDQGVAYVFISKVSVSGRILTAGGTGVANANVQITLANGGILMTRSSSFGYYRFDGIEADQTVTISVSSKRFQFMPQVVQVNDNLTNVDIIAQP